MPPNRQTTTPPPTPRLHVGTLLGACIDAARHSTAAIRAVQSAREAGTALNATYKDVSDPRSALTIADMQAQQAIVPPLQRLFPGLHIVGEEDGAMVDAGVELRTTCDLDTPPELCAVPVEDVCVFVDPLDGTLEFVRGNLECVQTLIGVCVRGEAVAGVVARPFVEDEPIYGMVGAGVGNLERGVGEEVVREDEVVVAVSKGAKGVVKDVVDVVAGRRVEMGGAGNKMVAVMKGVASVCVLNMITSLWDTAAATAVLEALGGCVTDVFGNRIEYWRGSRRQNCYGVIASRGRERHVEICRRVRRSMVADGLLGEVGLRGGGRVQATDIAVDLDGRVMSAEWLSGVLGRKVVGYSADEEGAVRYLMSDACRLRVWWEGGGVGSVFMKRVVMKDLEHVQLKIKTVPEKLERDVTSYQVETAFLASRACRELCERGTRIARAYFVDSRPAGRGVSPVESRFLMLVQDFDPMEGWMQVGFLEGGKMRCTLDALASLHAFFWKFGEEEAYDELVDAVWDQATYWVPKRQARDSFDKLEACWRRQRESFAQQIAEMELGGEEKDIVDDLGAILAKVAPACAEKVHGVGLHVAHPCRTIIHGDAKAANFFYRKKSDGALGGDDSNAWQVGMIDFQWCGWGHPAVDVAYVIAASAAPELLTFDASGEEAMLRDYHSSLLDYLVKYEKASDLESANALMPFDDLVEYYEETILDLARLVISYHWDRIKADPHVLESRKDMVGSNTYNKSIDCAKWLIARTVALLQKRKK